MLNDKFLKLTGFLHFLKNLVILSTRDKPLTIGVNIKHYELLR